MLLKLSKCHPSLHCRRNLGSRPAEQAHPNDGTGKHARKPVKGQVQQRDDRHGLRAEADSGEMQRTEYGYICSFDRETYRPPHISINGTMAPTSTSMEHFTYLGSIIFNDATVSKDLDNCLSKASSSFGRLSKRVRQSHSLLSP